VGSEGVNSDASDGVSPPPPRHAVPQDSESLCVTRDKTVGMPGDTVPVIGSHGLFELDLFKNGTC
jgi:hypothetical protein